MPDSLVVPSSPQSPVLVLLHGLGANSQVWDGWAEVLATSWPGRWLAPDLPGHGFAPDLPPYSFGGMAAHVAELLPRGAPVVVLGHSLGGVIGLALSSGWFGVHVTGVVGLGVKVAWTADELARAAAVAGRPTAWFDSRADAADRFLKLSGLAGLRSPDDGVVDTGLRHEGRRWRLAVDHAAFSVGAPDMAGLLAASRASVVLARGEHDPMVSDAALAGLPVESAVLRGLGHNAHVEDPSAVFDLLGRWIAARAG
jgi:pimeloyl-ACP methyl ester carboxylesterase